MEDIFTFVLMFSLASMFTFPLFRFNIFLLTCSPSSKVNSGQDVVVALDIGNVSLDDDDSDSNDGRE